MQSLDWFEAINFDYACPFCGQEMTEETAVRRGCCGEHIGRMIDLKDPQQRAEWEDEG